MPTTPTSQAATDARAIISNPEAYANRPSIRLLAWHVLKSARGQSLRQSNILLAAVTETDFINESNPASL